MQNIDPQTQYAKLVVMALFEDKYGRAKKKPYYVAQIKTIFEASFSDDVIYQAITQLVRNNPVTCFIYSWIHGRCDN
jgi:hypothetical protein